MSHWTSSNARSRHTGGTGLGLSIAHHLVRMARSSEHLPWSICPARNFGLSYRR